MRAKRKFLVTGEITISVNTEVMASSKEEAMRLADERGVMSLCHQCAGSDGAGEEWVTSGELDGIPRATEAQELPD